MLLLAEAVKVDVLTGLGYSAIGMVLIMLILALLMGCIYALSAVLKKMEEKNISVSGLVKNLVKKYSKKDTAVKDAEDSSAMAEVKPTATVAPGSAGDIKLNGVPEATAAMAMAIIADELNTPVNELHFISIKEIKE